ncbi:MAG: branched-chain amino acid ABC transporter permease, partial [Gaiellaceae bacterium]
PAVRLSGIYIYLVTFGLAVAVPSLAKKFDQFTGGSAGLLLPIRTGRYLYAAAWASAAALTLVAVLLLRGRTGRAFRALRDSEVAAVSSGVNIALYKTLAFGLSALYAGVAGSLLAIGAGYVNPDTFPPQLSLTILIGLAVGGFGPLPGLLVGAFFVELLPIYAQSWSKQAPQLVYGLVLLGAMLLQTLGVFSRVRLLARRMLTRS